MYEETCFTADANANERVSSMSALHDEFEPSIKFESHQLWAPISSLKTAFAEVLCYNEMTTTTSNKTLSGSASLLSPQCFYVQGNNVRFICFEGGDGCRIDMFRNAGLLQTLQNASWNKKMTMYCIRRIGSDPAAWIKQALVAYEKISINLLPTAVSPDFFMIEALVYEHAQELIREVFDSHIGQIVHLDDDAFPSMVNRIYRLYGVTPNYATVCIPCTDAKPCLLFTCLQCKKNRVKVHRRAAQAFLDPEYKYECDSMYIPPFLREIWGRPAVCGSCGS